MTYSENKLKEIILSELSRRNTDFVRDIVLNNVGLFGNLFEMVIENSEPLSRKAIWPLDYCLEKNPSLLNETQIAQLVDLLPVFCHEGIVRHTLRILNRYKIPHSHAGKLINICFNNLLNPKSSIASKAWSMDILYNFSNIENDLKLELISAIEFQLENASAGLKNHSQKLLNKLYSEITSA